MNEFYAKLGIDQNNSNRNLYYNSPFCFLMENAIKNGQGQLSHTGSLVVHTGKHSGRSANDKYVVKDEYTNDKIWWENTLHSMSPSTFSKLKSKVLSYLNEERDLYITERSVGAHEKHAIGVNLVTTHPSHAIFSKYLFRNPIPNTKRDQDFTILHAPEFKIDAKEFGTQSETVIATCFSTKTTIILGTLYAGEIKKSMFCVLNYVLPDNNVLPMHTGCSQLENGDTSLFFGLSGTGKTTLSTDEGTFLIGDDEHGLSDEGVFNFEGGCYAKTYKLSQQTEPGIYQAATRFGSLLENVILTDQTKEPDFFDKSLSENGRASYPLDFIDGIEPSSKGDVPKHIFFLSCDAFGVLPPVAELTREQAMFYFVLGYTAKVAGTEIGVKEPQATFSPCFGAPFMLRPPEVYAELLGGYLKKYPIRVWLVNTGWTGGPYGTGHRFPLNITRQLIRTIQAGTLKNIPMEKDSIFGFQVPQAVRNVPTSLLHPHENWPSKQAYEKQAQELAITFHSQMKKFGNFYEKNRAGAPLFQG